MQPTKVRLTERLRRAGKRLTPQRLELIRILEQMKSRHPSFSEVYRAVKNRHPTISRSTVYNNLKVMEELGLLISFDYRGETRYELNLEPHINLVKPNGVIEDLEDEEIKNHLRKVLRILNEKYRPIKWFIVLAG